MKNTETLLTFDEVKRNKEIIVPRIAEGNPLLERIIMHCIEMDIPTIACCNGHSIFDKPYITMQYNGDTRKNINAFLNGIKDKKGIEIMFSTTGFTENPFNVTIYTNMQNRDEIFKIIAETLDKDEESEYLDENLESALNVAIDLDYAGRYGRISILNQRFKMKYMLGIYAACKGNLFEDYSAKKKQGEYGMSYYLYRTANSIRLASKDFEELIPTVNYRRYGFSISMALPVNDKVDRISELNDSMREKSGSIRRF